MNTSAAQLVTVANALRREEGAERAAGRLLHTAAVILLLAGVKACELNERLANALRDFGDTGDETRH